MDKLTDREWRVLSERFDRRLTVKSLAEELEVSEARVRQIQARAIEKLLAARKEGRL